MSDSKTYVFHVAGMHCSACEILIEDELGAAPGVSQVKANLAKNQVTVTLDNPGEPEAITKELSAKIASKGYSLQTEKIKPNRQWQDFWYAVPLAAILIIIFVYLQKIGLVNLVSGSRVNYATALLIGAIASVSTCLAVVGGLTLSLSANYAKSGAKFLPHVMFHTGRLVGFFLLGGLLGLLGKSFNMSLSIGNTLGLVVAVIMLILGLNLLDVFKFTKKLQFRMPKITAKHATRQSVKGGRLTPIIIGVITFFLPCGFTQSMQVYALTTGSFLTGALTMATFALGTLPALALLSFGSFSLAHKSWSGIFFKTAGLIVMTMALFNLANILAVMGIINPIFNF